MVVVPIPNTANETQAEPWAPRPEPNHWVRIAAAGTLIAGGILLFNGKRRAGMVAAATGTALAVLDQKETLHSWWRSLPRFLDDASQLLGQVQGVVTDLAVEREKLREMLNR
jgi:hypothetical protein